MSVPRLWRDLRAMTSARVALGRSGNAVPTAAHLTFQADHAAARDAVWSALDVPLLMAGATMLDLPAVSVISAARDRATYLRRPDLGRRLQEGDAERLAKMDGAGQVVFVIADGLCARGVQTQALGVVEATLPSLRRAGFAPGPVVIAEQARVALGDAIGAAIGAVAVVVLIGERPGLSSTDSLGAYLTWGPEPGLADAARNCISNIRPAGLSARAAAGKIVWLLEAARRSGGTGVALKDEQPEEATGLAFDPG